MSFSIDNHNGHVGWIIIMSFGKKILWMLWCKMDSEHEFIIWNK